MKRTVILKRLIYWVCVFVVMCSLLWLIDLFVIKPLYDGSTLDMVVLVLVHGLWYIITFNMTMFKYKWTERFKE